MRERERDWNEHNYGYLNATATIKIRNITQLYLKICVEI